MSENIITLSNAQLAFGHHPLLDHAELAIDSGERIGLIGRNGAGKSSLLRVLAGSTTLDDGIVRRRSGLRTSMVPQEPQLPENQLILDYLCGDMLQHEDWQRQARAAALMDELGLAATQTTTNLSGGTRKRVALARALVQEPDLLLLDEPTNHLDFDGIEFLQEQLLRARCSVVLISHDRHFLDVVSTRIIELERGQILGFPGNFSAWQERKAEWLAAQDLANARFDKLLSQEEVWIRKGVEARRTRNEGRVRRLEALRRERAARREQQGQVRFSLGDGQRSGKLVAELKNVSHGFGSELLIKNFSAIIQRGDRIGLIGPNGAGKTTLLRVLLGELAPQSGTVRLGTKLSIGYFDQMRTSLDEAASLADTISPGSEWVSVGAQRKHVMSYLEDFLFPPARAQSPVASLSGGERARLALARMFAQEHNVLVLDEPTNDLDIDTLELLESLLQDYAGTVLLVSHDRSFLDNVVTQVIVAQGAGHWQEYVGGFSDWYAQRQAPTAGAKTTPDKDTPTQNSAKKTPETPPGPARKARLAPWEASELDALPDAIHRLEQELQELTERLSDPALYADGSGASLELQEQINALNQKLEASYARWSELEEKL